MSNAITSENGEPSILGVVLRVTGAMIVSCLLFLALGMTVVGWKVCCDLGSSEFVERDAAVSSVVDEMGPEWPFQSIEVDTNNTGDILIQRNWLGINELQAIVFNADHEREIAESNKVDPALATDTEWVFHNDYERGGGVILKSAAVATFVLVAALRLLRFTSRGAKTFF
jgi:hypothetical protein